MREELNNLIQKTDPFVIKEIILTHCINRFKKSAEECSAYADDFESYKHVHKLLDTVAILEDIIKKARAEGTYPEIEDMLDYGLRLIKYSQDNEDFVPTWQEE